MKVDIKGNELSFDGRRESLLASILAQNCSSETQFRKKVDEELLGFIGLVPEMGPEHIVVLRWHSGYELGYPNDFYGIGAIACRTIKPWTHHPVDHIIQHRNPFSKVTDAMLLNQISLDYDSLVASIMERNDSMYDYFVPDLIDALKEVGFTCKYSRLEDSEELSGFGSVDIEDYLLKTYCASIID